MASLHTLRGEISMVAIILLLPILLIGTHVSEAQVGVCYGLVGKLPPPWEVIALYQKKNITRMRLFGSDRGPLQALRGTNIELIVGIFNSDLPSLAASQYNADKWVRDVIKSHQDVKFRYIAVGNEVSPLKKANARYTQFLVPAMRHIYKAIHAAGLGNKIKVSTALDTGLLGEAYPPSRGVFKSGVRYFVDPVIRFLVKTHAPLLVNLYPYFSYASNPKHMRLDHAIFNSTKVFAYDGRYVYMNVFDALLDATYAALEKAGGGALEIVVSETGWPSGGGAGTTIQSARMYNNRLIHHVKFGTPKRPGKAIETYIFAMFDETKNPEVEKHWGLFHPDKQPKYRIWFR